MPPKKDRKSTRLNSSHLGSSYAVFCLKKKKQADGGTRTASITGAMVALFDALKVIKNRCVLYFFFNDTPTTDIYTLSLHDALPIYRRRSNESDLSRADTEQPSRQASRLGDGG